MPVRIVQLGDPRHPGEGLRIGTVRRPPRGVKKADYARLDYFDVWLPELSPSAALVSAATAEAFTPARWTRFERSYHREMREAVPARLIALLAALSHQTSFSVGCYCEDESRCHRSLLRRLLMDAGADVE